MMKFLKLIILQVYWYISLKYGSDFKLPIIGTVLFLTDFLVFRKNEKLKNSYLCFSIILIFLDLF